MKHTENTVCSILSHLPTPQHHQILNCQFLVSRKMKIAPLKLGLNSLAIHFEILKANIEMN